MSKAASLMKWIGASALLLALAGCNTIEGAGEDIEKAGEAIQKAAD
jgi:predicted small secreted protein